MYEQWQGSPEGILLDRLGSKLIVNLLRPQKRERALDIGCGTGNHLLLLYRYGMDITGLDASPYMLEKARSRLGNNAVLKNGRAQELPFDDNEFDVSVLIFTLEFIEDPVEVLNEAGRVTKDRVFIGIFNWLSLEGLYKKFSSLFRNSIFRNTRLYSLHSLLNCTRCSYGNVPMEWGSVKLMPGALKETATEEIQRSWVQANPFGTFLGLACKMTYTLKVEEIRLLDRLRKRSESLIGDTGI